MPIIPSLFAVKNTPRVDFRAAGFRKMVNTNGAFIEWEMCSECPCDQQNTALGMTLTALAGGDQEGGTGQPRPDCPTCSGKGYRYHSLQPIRGVVMGATTSPNRKEPGDMIAGTVSVTVMPEHRLSKGDRLTLVDDPDNPDDADATVHLYRESHNYAGEATSTLKYPVLVRALKTSPSRRLGVMDVYVTDAGGIAQVGGERTEGVDFTVTAAGAIQWLNPPVTGGRFSISYYASPVYVVVNLPHPHRDTVVGFKRLTPTFESLPLQAHCMLEYLSPGVVTRGT